MSLLDSDIKTVKIGKRSKKRELYIYPFSIKDQKEFLKIYVDALNSLLLELAEPTQDQHEFLANVYTIVVDNIELVLRKVTFGEDIDKLLDEITNKQILDIADVVFDQNFGNIDLKKKYQAVTEKYSKILQM